MKRKSKFVHGHEVQFNCYTPFEVERVDNLYGEEEYLNAICSYLFPNASVADVGAAIGTSSLIFSAWGGIVAAYEPDHTHYQRLIENISLNPWANITPHQEAVGEKYETRTLHISGNTNAQCPSFIRQKGHSSITHVSVIPLSHKFDVVKIDVEGFEEEVIKGIQILPEILAIEFHPKIHKFNYSLLSEFEQMYSATRAKEILTIWKLRSSPAL